MGLGRWSARPHLFIPPKDAKCLMARKPRINLKGYPQYIMQRGHNRLPCFFGTEDYQFFLQCLEKSAAQYQCDLHTYALLENEVHLIVTPHIEGGVSQMMQSLGRRYVQYINHRYARSGTLWEGRYKSSLIDSSAYLITCSRYIEALPIDVGLAEAPENYSWSSFRHHALAEENLLLTPHQLFLELGDTDKERARAYRDFLGFELDPGIKKHIAETLSMEMVLGGDMFKYRIQAMLNRPVRPKKRGRPPKK